MRRAAFCALPTRWSSRSSSGRGDSVVSRFTVSSGDPNLADPNSEVILLGRLAATSVEHKGGDRKFGPDGMLNYSLGGGWGGGANVDLRDQDSAGPRGSVAPWTVPPTRRIHPASRSN